MKEQTKKIVHFRPLFYSFLILTLAISCAKFIFDGKLSYILLVVGIFASLLLFCIIQKKLIYFIVLFAVFGFGIGWYFLGMSMFVGKEYSGVCQITGRVSDDLSYSEYEDSFTVVLKSAKINNKKDKNILLTVNFESAEDIKIGDVISFSAKLENIKSFKLGQFQSFYYRDNVAYTAEIESSQVSILKNKMTLDEKIRQKARKSFSKMKYGGVAYAVIFGDKVDLPKAEKTAFINAGVVHLLTVSGLHISFLIGLLSFLLKKCRARGWLNLLICTIFVLFYAFLCGFSPSVTRACVMGLVLSLASAFGKRYDSLSAMGLAGILILLVRPLFALDLGFLMSFFCVMSIFMLYPVFKRLFDKAFPSKVSATIALTLAAQIGSFPFILQINEKTNLLSVFANMIIVPIFSVVYPLLFVSTLLVLILPFMSFLFKVIDYGFVCVCKLAEFFGQTHVFGSFDQPNAFTIAICFIAVFSLSLFVMVDKKTKILLCCGLLCLASVSIVLPDFWKKAEPGISVCYEYSNSVILLTNNSQESVIIDIGSSSFTKRLLKIQNVEKVSAVFVLQSSRVKADALRDVGCQKLIRTGNGEGYAEENLVELDTFGKVGNFVFRYRSDQNKMVGLEIIFDDIKVFITRDRYTTVKNFEVIGKDNYDFVLLGKNPDFDSVFEKTDKIAGFYHKTGVFSSFEKNGNMQFLLKNKNFVGRCLD